MTFFTNLPAFVKLMRCMLFRINLVLRELVNFTMSIGFQIDYGMQIIDSPKMTIIATRSFPFFGRPSADDKWYL